MVEKYYIDTSIWMDIYEDRNGFNQEPLGDFALKLFNLINTRKKTLIISDLLIAELQMNYSVEEINGMIKPFEHVIEKIISSEDQKDEAQKIGQERNLPPGDVLHAIIARDNNAILVTRDKHFRDLRDISEHKKPEDII